MAGLDFDYDNFSIEDMQLAIESVNDMDELDKILDEESNNFDIQFDIDDDDTVDEVFGETKELDEKGGE